MRGKTLVFAAGALAAGYVVKRLWKRRYNEEKSRGDAEEKLKQLYYHWLLLKQRGVSLADCLREDGVERLAVLGLGPPGRRLINDLEGTDTMVLYAVERDNPSAIHERLEVLRLRDDPLPEVDAVVVCTLRDFEAINGELRGETEARVIALEELIVKALESEGMKTRDGVLNPLNLKASE